MGPNAAEACKQIKHVLRLSPVDGVSKPSNALLSLDLSLRQLTSVPAELGQATALQTLRLDGNRLTSVPAELGQATALQTLHLDRNRLTSFPAELGQAKALQLLYLTNNRLTSFPAEMGQATALVRIELSHNQLTHFPAEMGKAAALNHLNLGSNQLTSFPAEMGQSKALETLFLSNNHLTTFPAEMGQVTTLETLDLSNNQLTNFPAEMGKATGLKHLSLADNQLTSFPPEMLKATALKKLSLQNNQLASLPAEIGQATALSTLKLAGNRLDDVPVEIAQLPYLRQLDLSHNRFTVVPRALLDLPSHTEINLRNNPLPEAEIVAVREAIARRRAAGQTVPMMILPRLAGEADQLRAVNGVMRVEDGGLRAAAADSMNVHTGVLTDAFKARLDDVAGQFPGQLRGGMDEQRAEMTVIELRLSAAFNTFAAHHVSDPKVLRKARKTANLMFQKGQGVAREYLNDFQHSAGHVLAYTFLALEAQLARTPEAHQSEARQNGMAALTNALASGTGWCDTRLCEEVMQTIGLPYSKYADANPDAVNITSPPITASESRDVILGAAKQVLRELLEANPELTSETPPANWRATLAERMQRDHPKVPPEQVDKWMKEMESMWQTFHEIAIT